MGHVKSTGKRNVRKQKMILLQKVVAKKDSKTIQLLLPDHATDVAG